MKVNEAPANEVHTVYDVNIDYPNYGEFHFPVLVGKFTDTIIEKGRQFVITKEMDFKGDAPNITPGQSVYLK